MVFTKARRTCQSLYTVKMRSQYFVKIVSAFFSVLSVAQAVQLKQKPLAEYIQYTSVPNYFLQDSNSTNATTFSFVSFHLPSGSSILFEIDFLTVWLLWSGRDQLWADQPNLPRRRTVRPEGPEVTMAEIRQSSLSPQP